MSLTTFTADETRDLEDKYTLPRMVCLPAGLVGLWFLGHPWPNDHPAVIAAWTLFTAYAMFCWTSCFHETAHQTLTSNRWTSVLVGRALGILMWVPYNVYRESHIRHHAYLNKPTDWELWPYSDPHASLAFRRLFVWLDLFLGVFTAPYMYGRIFFHKNSPLKDRALRRAIWGEYACIVLFWGTLFTLFTLYNGWWGYLRIWFTPVCLAGVLQNGRKLTEHLGMSSFDPMLGTRTVLGKNWITRLGTFVNFDIFIHGPHHRHPRVSHNLLGQKMEEYLQTNPALNYPVDRHYWQATLAMLPAMWRTPGVGVNAGAAMPGQDRQSDVQDFVADVSYEVLADSDRLVQ